MSKQDHLPPGILRETLTKSGRHNIFRDAPVMLGAWAFIMLIPWEAIGEGNGAMPWAVKAYQKFAAEGFGGMPWGATLVTLFFIAIIYSLVMGGLKAISSPHKLPEIQMLKAYGPIRDQIEEFEFEAAKYKMLEWKNPDLVATANWVMLRREGSVLLIPIQKIVWAYDRNDRMNGAMSFGLGQMGVLSKRQQRLEKMLGDRVFEFWLEDIKEPKQISLPGFGVDKVELVNHLLEWNKSMIWGYSPQLEKLFNKDREAFPEAALAAIQAGAKMGDDDIFDTLGSALDIADNVSDAANLMDKK